MDRFFACCKALAFGEGCISSLQSIGLNVDPSDGSQKDLTFADLLYGMCDELISVAMSYLKIDDYKEREQTYNAILNAVPNNYISVARRVWDSYGIK